VDVDVDVDKRNATSGAESSASVACSEASSGRPFQRMTTLPPTAFD
jgi:hypothetical protein